MSMSDNANVITSAASAVAAVAALFISIRSNKAADRSNEAADTANRAAESANLTAEAVARIEHDRWHTELTPQFDITLTEIHNSGGRVKAHIYLSGPDCLQQLDEIKVRIESDDMLHQAREGDPEVTQEGYDNFVWGPFRFPFGADGADQAGQTVAPFSLRVGKGRPLVLERTRPGRWMTSTTFERWQEQYNGYPIRFVLTCRHGDHEWILARPVAQPSGRPRIRDM